jgi:HlyD family secretion protein
MVIAGRVAPQILVDETEVVRVERDQIATIEVDAFPELKLTGRVTEVGNSAYNAGPLGSQEAKDFRVRIVLEGVPGALRPGLSARAEIETARRTDALAIPIEALTIRDPDAKKRTGRKKTDERDDVDDTKEKEGVFLFRDGKAEFVPIQTGIAGKKHFEVLSGVSEGDLVIRGPFESIRKLETGDAVKEKKKSASRKLPAREETTESSADGEG